MTESCDNEAIPWSCLTQQQPLKKKGNRKYKTHYVPRERPVVTEASCREIQSACLGQSPQQFHDFTKKTGLLQRLLNYPFEWHIPSSRSVLLYTRFYVGYFTFYILHIYMVIYIHTYIVIYIHTYIGYINTLHIHTYMETHVCQCRHTFTPLIDRTH